MLASKPTHLYCEDNTVMVADVGGSKPLAWEVLKANK